ncbi:MAG: hypothetical protein NUV56_01015, partial [Candidatus Uhrbacteria bacterium]|nr:hypothetical protein [Candidatus Uhrbacteria bacterium]
MTSLRTVFGVIALGVLFALPFSGTRVAFAQEDPLADVESEGIIFAGPALCGLGSVQADCDACRERGQCTLEQVLQVFVNLANFTLGISGTVLLFVFVYGGFKWL